MICVEEGEYLLIVERQLVAQDVDVVPDDLEHNGEVVHTCKDAYHTIGWLNKKLMVHNMLARNINVVTHN